MRAWGAALLVVALLAAYSFATDRRVEWRPGVLVESQPEQSPLVALEADARPAEGTADFTILPRATFRAEVRVVARERYRFDALAAVAPLDLAVAWGPLSDSSILDELSIWQSGRFFHWRAEELPLPLPVIEGHLANWHIVPASEEAWRQLRRIRVGDVVTLEGMLVDLQSASTGRVRTSLTRKDRGAGACEIVWVESVAFRYR